MVEHRKAPSLGAAEDGLDLRCSEKGQRVVEDMPDGIEAPRIVQIPAIVDDRAHLLLALFQVGAYHGGRRVTAVTDISTKFFTFRRFKGKQGYRGLPPSASGSLP